VAATFDQARDAFEAAWRVFLARRAEVGFDVYRRSLAFPRLEGGHVGGRTPAADAGCGRPVDNVESHVLAAHMQQVSC